jgi:hypothetical protein
MCDYSLHNIKSRSARIGETLTTKNFGTGTVGFASPEDTTTAVCILPGTELAFAEEVKCGSSNSLDGNAVVTGHTVAIFRQINKDNPYTHHDALEFPDGEVVLLTHLFEGQEVSVIQLPAQAVSTPKAQVGEPLEQPG